MKVSVWILGVSLPSGGDGVGHQVDDRCHHSLVTLSVLEGRYCVTTGGQVGGKWGTW